MTIVKLTFKGTHRVLNGETGLTFIVDSFTGSRSGGLVAHVRDYRYMTNGRPQLWSLSPEHYEVVEDTLSRSAAPVDLRQIFRNGDNTHAFSV